MSESTTPRRTTLFRVIVAACLIAAPILGLVFGGEAGFWIGFSIFLVGGCIFVIGLDWRR